MVDEGEPKRFNFYLNKFSKTPSPITSKTFLPDGESVGTKQTDSCCKRLLVSSNVVMGLMEERRCRAMHNARFFSISIMRFIRLER